MKIKTSIFLTAVFLVSPVLAQELSWEALNASIEKNRKGVLVIEGSPGDEVAVEQVSHEFWFGCAISSGIFSDNTRATQQDIQTYKEKFLENFNSAVTENAVKWGSMERRQGEINYTTTENILNWTELNGIPCRGHNLYWGIDKFVQPWVKDLSDKELMKALEKRGVETAKRFKGRFYEYDLNNEMIHGNYYEERLGEGITLKMANWVLEGDPEAKLWLNDYDILTGRRLNDFIHHAEKLIDDGVPVAGLGVQGHLHGDSFSREALQESLDALGELGLPVRITEFNMPGQRSQYYRDKSIEFTVDDEIRKAKDLVDYYRICFAHPSVEGILMWGFWEGANWIPASSLYHRDWSPTPALVAYQQLIFEEWNTDLTITLDENGEAEIPAFFGDYEITSGEKTVKAALRKSEGKKLVEL